MRKIYFAFILLASALLFSSSRTDETEACAGDGSRKSAGPPSCYAGEPPGNFTCATAGCHDDFPLNSGNAQLSLNLGGADTNYIPGQQYTVTVSLSRTGLVRGGFQMVALQDNDITTSPGIITLLEPSRTQRIDAAHPHQGPCATQNKVWIQHTADGIDDVANNTIQWQYNWLAPAADVGGITFYVVALDANNDLDNSGDRVHTLSRQITPAISTRLSEVDFTSPRLFPNPVSATLTVMVNDAEVFFAERFVVANAQGKQLLESTSRVIDVSVLSPGIYSLRIYTGEKNYALRFVKL